MQTYFYEFSPFYLVGKYLGRFEVLLQALTKGVGHTIKPTPFVIVQSNNLGLPKLFPLPIT